MNAEMLKLAKELTESNDIDIILDAYNKLINGNNNVSTDDYNILDVEIYKKSLKIVHSTLGSVDLNFFKHQDHLFDIFISENDFEYVINHSRQIGITMIVTVALVYRAIRKREDIAYIHSNRGYVDSVIDIIHVNPEIMKHVVKINRYDGITFNNGSKIYFYHHDRVSQIGKKDCIFIDNAAFISYSKDAKFDELMDINRFSKVIIASIPNYERGFFYDRFTKDSENIIKIEFPFSSLDDPFSPERKKEEVGEERYNQEYDCKFKPVQK